MDMDNLCGAFQLLLAPLLSATPALGATPEILSASPLFAIIKPCNVLMRDQVNYIISLKNKRLSMRFSAKKKIASHLFANGFD